jgi:poly-beta-1,6-N-acetyl-D-glucosamine synthase
MAQGRPRYGDEAFRKFFHRYQMECLMLGKKKATERADARQAAVWNPKG